MKLDYEKPSVEYVDLSAEAIMGNILDGSMGGGDSQDGWE